MNTRPMNRTLRWTFGLLALALLMLLATGGALAWSLSLGDWPMPEIWIDGDSVDLHGSLAGSAGSVAVGLLVAAIVVAVVLIVLPLVLLVAVGVPLLLVLLGVAVAALAVLAVGGLLLSPLLLLVLPLVWAWSRSRRPRHGAGGDNVGARMEPR